MNIRPLGNHLHVKPITFEKTTGGVHLPPSLQDEFNVGGPKLFRVLSVGPGRVGQNGERVPIEAEPGDRVLCHSYTTGPADLGDGTKMITADEILAVLPHPTNETKTP